MKHMYSEQVAVDYSARTMYFIFQYDIAISLQASSNNREQHTVHVLGVTMKRSHGSSYLD